MAGPHSWTVLFLTISFGVFSVEASNCPKTINNGQLASNCTSLTGTVCDFSCNHGYNKNASITKLTCLNHGKWNFTGEVCTPASNCPKTINNGQLASNCTSLTGTVCDFSCNHGYNKNASITKLTCLNHGKWNFTGEVCTPASNCPKTINNGQLASNCTSLTGTVCDFSCNHGYNKNASITKLTCLNHGKWNFTGEVCTPASNCPKTINNGQLASNCTSLTGTVCDFSCNHGYNKNASITKLTCLNHGKWNFTGEVCTPASNCPKTIKNGQLASNCTSLTGTVCDFSCNHGYNKNASITKLTCLNHGKWNFTGEVCTPASNVYCPKTINNGQLASTCTSLTGTVCDFSCNPGYNKNASITKLTCLNHGKWNFTGEVCTPASNVYCPKTINNGHLASTCTSAAGTVCDFSCNAGYNKNAVLTKLACLNDGKWNIKGEVCTPASNVYCPKTINNGQLASTCTSAAGTVCDFSCNAGYNKNAVLTKLACLNDGKWNIKGEVCTLDQNGIATYSQKPQNEGTSGGAVAGIVIAVILTIVIVLGIVYFVWWRKKPQGTFFSKINRVKFSHFDDTNVPADSGVSGFSNATASQPENGNFSHLRDEGYITTKQATPYDKADPTRTHQRPRV